MIAEARRGSTPTTEIIRIAPLDPLKTFAEAEEKLSKLSDDISHLERQSLERNGNVTPSSPKKIFDEFIDKSSPLFKEKSSPDKLPDDSNLNEVRM